MGTAGVVSQHNRPHTPEGGLQHIAIRFPTGTIVATSLEQGFTGVSYAVSLIWHCR